LQAFLQYLQSRFNSKNITLTTRKNTHRISHTQDNNEGAQMRNEQIDALIEKRGILKGLNSTLGITAISLVVVFILYTILLGKAASDQFFGLKSWIEHTLGWYYIVVMFSAFLICVFFMFSKAGAIRLGRDDERPEFSNFAWFSMLFGCGTGAGMLFFSMSEPMIHFASGWSGGNPFMSADVKAAVSDFFAAKQAALAAGLLPGQEGFPVPDAWWQKLQRQA
jgi:choline/glycine/proline betaine transport protein